MTDPDSECGGLSLCVLILLPVGRDAVLTAAVLDGAAIQSTICTDVAGVKRAVDGGGGALLVAEEAISNGGLQELATLLALQESWSDLPVLLLTQYGADSTTVSRSLKTLGNVTLLERPVRPATLISAVQTALKARKRQYQVRAQLIEQSRTNAALEESEGRLRAVVDQAMAGIAQYDLDGRFLLANRRFCEIVGYTSEQLLTLLHQDLTHPLDMQSDAQEYSQTVIEQRRYVIEMRYFRPDGSIVWVRNSLAVLADKEGMPQSIVAIIIDITESKLSDDRSRFQAELLDAVGQAAIATNAEGNVIYWNHFAEILYGWTKAEVMGRSIIELVVDSSARKQAAEILGNLRSGKSWSGEILMRHQSGKVFPAYVTDTPIFDDQGRLHAIIGVSTDISERKRIEEELREADRRKDDFLATLAHELRNPLAPIRNSLHILQLSSAHDSATGQVCEMLERQVGHLVRLVDDLMEVSRITRGNVELRVAPVELAAIIQSAVEECRPMIDASGHLITISIPTEPMIINGDADRLSQVFANLVNNAAKYMNDGGQIWLSAKQVNDNVIVSIRDSGIGIPGEMLPHIFKMFMQVDRSSRKAQGGLGIGFIARTNACRNARRRSRGP